jgi:hypothetical protein
MWKIKLDDTLWLAKISEATTSEKQALLLPDTLATQNGHSLMSTLR